MTEQNIRPDDDPTTVASDEETEAHILYQAPAEQPAEAEAHRYSMTAPAEQPAEAEAHEAGADTEAVPETEAHILYQAPAEQPAE